MGIHHLTVVRDFGDYHRGDHIEDDAEIARIMGGELRNHVVKVHADVRPGVEAKKEEPAAAAQATAEKAKVEADKAAPPADTAPKP